MNRLTITLAMLSAQAGALFGPMAASGLASSAASSSIDKEKDISVTTVMEDLRTDKDFETTYATKYPKKDALGTDAFGNKESEWQAISATAGVRNWTETYFYFYHPLCNTPQWKSADGLTVTTDVDFRVSLSTNGSSGAYSHFDMAKVDSSSDIRFWKFVVKNDFGSLMKEADLRYFDISEFEILSKAHTTSNSYRIGKRFSWEKGKEGSYSQKVEDIGTITLNPFYDYHRIAGKNGHTSDSSIGSITTHEKTVMNEETGETKTQTFTWSDWTYRCSQTDVFYTIFPLKKTMGTLCGADLEYGKYNDYGCYGITFSGFDETFNQDFMGNIDGGYKEWADNPRSKNFTWECTAPVEKTTSNKIRLSTGEDEDYKGLTSLTTSEVETKYPQWASWWSDHEAWSLGYADKYNLPTIQKLEPQFGSLFVKDDDYNHVATNPMALSPKTNAYLKGEKSSPSFDINDYYILRFEMENLSLYSTTTFVPTVGYASKGWAWQKWNMTDVDVMDLHLFKSGNFYTIGVVADSGQIITNIDVVEKGTSASDFSWRWLLVTAAAIILFGIVWLLVKTLRAAFGGNDK